MMTGKKQIDKIAIFQIIRMAVNDLLHFSELGADDLMYILRYRNSVRKEITKHGESEVADR